jgi:hypothetical protein
MLGLSKVLRREYYTAVSQEWPGKVVAPAAKPPVQQQK